MKVVKNYAEYSIDGKDMIILSKNYNGSPMFCHQYDIIIGPREVIERFTKELFAEHQLKKGWLPIIRFI